MLLPKIDEDTKNPPIYWNGKALQNKKIHRDSATFPLIFGWTTVECTEKLFPEQFASWKSITLQETIYELHNKVTPKQTLTGHGIGYHLLYTLWKSETHYKTEVSLILHRWSARNEDAHNLAHVQTCVCHVFMLDKVFRSYGWIPSKLRKTYQRADCCMLIGINQTNKKIGVFWSSATPGANGDLLRSHLEHFWVYLVQWIWLRTAQE